MADGAPPSPFAGTAAVAPLTHADGVVTLVEGHTFALSGRTGDMSADSAHGLFLRDTRILSQWELRIEGHRLEPLTVDITEPFAATFVGRARPAAGHADADVVVFRDRCIGAGMREVITVSNHGVGSVDLSLEVGCDADFADLFEVKELRVVDHDHDVEPTTGGVRFARPDLRSATADVRADPAPDATGPPLAWTLHLPTSSSASICLEVTAALDGEAIAPRFRCGEPDHDTEPVQRQAAWRAAMPSVVADSTALTTAVRRAGDDLGALRIEDPDHPGTPVVAAGAPWFMALFGRDSLLTSWMTIPAGPDLAVGTLQTLARRQGTDVVATTEEEPGRILHEVRFGSSGRLALGGGGTYYGSIDSTPLFVGLVGELHRWGVAPAVLEELLPHVDRALAWIEDFGDRDGDGFVEYEAATPRGLSNQGWKDSWDAIRHADGSLAEPPIALCEVQGYVYSAYIARAELAAAAGDSGTEQRFRARADALRQAFHQQFWVEELGTFALGLDGRKRPIAVPTSNAGHCLWSGIVEPAHAERVAGSLAGAALFSGWGVRTLAAGAAAFNPVSYHNGSVWPHDNAVCIAGLARYGHLEEAHRLLGAQLDVADHHGGRLPELFAGFERGRPPSPAAYPTSCSPQAWAAAAPLLWLRSLLRLDPDVPNGVVHVAPALPSWMRHLAVGGVQVDGRRLGFEVVDGRVAVSGAGSLPVVLSPRAVHRGDPPPEPRGGSRRVPR